MFANVSTIRLVLPTFVLLSLLMFAGAASTSGCSNELYSQPPLHDAAKRGNIKRVKKLLREGSKVNAKNREGATPLHWAAFKGHIDVAQALLARGANPNARTKKGNTPLALALEHGQKDRAALLRRRGGKE